MSEQNQNQGKEPLLDHEYDGIRELDHPLPGWWLATFYFTIAFAVGYFAYYMLGNGPGLVEEFNQDWTRVQIQQVANKKPFPDDSALEAVLKDPGSVKLGAVAFQEKCASCHAADGGGSIGPNLTDRFWINGDGSAASVAKLIAEGSLAKGMPAWAGVIPDQEIYHATAYLVSIQGTTPAKPKAPQGTEIKK